MKQKLNLMSGAALAVLALAPACAAHAQDASGGKTIGDVVITATHTGATNLQKTPISVDVVTGSDLTADSDDAAHLFRDDRAHHSEMMPPIRGVFVGGLI
jgi:outer membrane receptor for ferrienterochelin and colicin